ncbi:Cof-type HAD-IIB family hydrolase [Risungbinella massiliensis]|uniref:Cof-type HAD-IIB family hydrolase n=1 Tax=Risungbinella massiliensis TaxID=1329796 RepID=UPI0006996D36|nr:Cof-type HAD-IIB family hydrolase [Risungbinella massiliensis]
MQNLTTRFLVSDLDDTLLSSDKTISESNKASIDQFRKAGGQFTIATGRCVPEALEYIKELNLSLPAILGNGAVTYEPATDELNILDQLSEETVHHILEHGTNRPPQSDILIYTPTEIYTADLRYLDLQDFQNYYSKIEVLPSFTELPKDEPILKIVLVSDPNEMNLVWDWANQMDQPVDYVLSSERYFEILPKNVSKGNAVLQLLDRLQIPKEEAAAVGDHMNDLSMLSLVGKAFAVANAHPTTIQTADHVIPSNNESAIHHIIQEYLLQDLKEVN